MPPAVQTLTEREREVLALMARGLANMEIECGLISPGQVNTPRG